MAKKGKIHCVYCGEENDKKNLKCFKCKKDLDPKSHLLKDFLYKHIKDELKGKVEDNIFSLIKNFIISNLYGSSIVATVLFTTSVIVISNLIYNSGVTYVNNTNEIQNKLESKSINGIIVNLYTHDDGCNPDVDLSNVGFITDYTISGNRKKLLTINFKSTSSIESWCENNESSIVCKEKVSLLNEELTNTANKYKNLLSEYIDWYRKTCNNPNSKSCSEKYLDYNTKLNDYIDELTYWKDDTEEFDKKTSITKNTDLYIPYVGCIEGE